MKIPQSINTMNISLIRGETLAQRNDACARLIANAYSLWRPGSALDMPLGDSIQRQPKYRKKTIPVTLQEKRIQMLLNVFRKCNSSKGVSYDL